MPRRIELPQEYRGPPFRASDAIAAGVGRERLRGKDLVRPFAGVRVAASADLDFEQRCHALALRLGPDSAFSHATAARLWGTPLPWRVEDSESLHVVTRRPGTRIRVSGATGHTAPNDTPFSERFGLPVTDPLTTWIALAGQVPLDYLVAAGDHLVLTPRFAAGDELRPYVSLAELTSGATIWTGRHCRAVRAAASLVRDGAESVQETRLRLAMVRAGLPEPLLNLDVADARGRFLGRGDMVYREWGVIVEYDGDHHRTDARQYDRDFTRHEAFTAAGWRHVRVRRFGMAEGPASGVARAEAALRAAGWRPGARNADPAPPPPHPRRLAEKSETRPKPGFWTGK